MIWPFKIIRKVNPEISILFMIKGKEEPEYRCSGCGTRFDLSVSEYTYCPGCGNRVDWNNVIDNSLNIKDIINGPEWKI